MSSDLVVHYCECTFEGALWYDKLTDQVVCSDCEGIITDIVAEKWEKGMEEYADTD